MEQEFHGTDILSEEEIIEKTSKEFYSLSESEECDSSCDDKKNICMECKKIYEERES